MFIVSDELLLSCVNIFPLHITTAKSFFYDAIEILAGMAEGNFNGS